MNCPMKDYEILISYTKESFTEKKMLRIEKLI